MSTTYDWVKRADEFGITLEEGQVMKFRQYHQLLIDWNEKMNLTAITKLEDVQEKHFIDSMMILTAMDVQKDSKVIDIGTGAGFPSVPMKIVREDLKMTLVDALQKRVKFLKELSELLELQMDIVHGRAEELIKEKGMRESFDYGVSRAVAKLGVLAEYVLPYIRIGGKFIAWKGPSGQDERRDAEKAIDTLGAKISEIKEYELITGEKRMLIVMEKVGQTPEVYPRKNAMIKSKPL